MQTSQTEVINTTSKLTRREIPVQINVPSSTRVLVIYERYYGKSNGKQSTACQV